MRPIVQHLVQATGLLAVIALAAPPAAADFAEGNASQWGSFASDSAFTQVVDASDRVRAGDSSVRFDTESGFDTGVTYPAAGNAGWDLTGKTLLEFWAYASNDNPNGFQGNQPVVVLKTPSGDARYEPQSTRMWNRAWHRYHVPLDGDDTWVRTDTGTPDFTNVGQIEIHHDTWDSGFSVWYDGVEFTDHVAGSLPPAGPLPPTGVDPDVVQSRALLFVFDPVMENKGGARMHDAYGWFDPVWLTDQVVSDLAGSSHGLALYEVVETVIVDDYPYHLDGFRYDDASYDDAWNSSTWHDSGFDYARFVADANLASRIERGEIDEVWVYGAPGFGMWESTMAGDAGYWCNSGPVDGVPSERLFVIMGWNFERGVAEAIHSWGHRAESVMVHSYGEWLPDRSNNWNAFTLRDLDDPGNGGVGNVHFPVNGEADYDYDNPRRVKSDAADWYNYPDLTGQKKWVDNTDWSPTGTDPHREYLNWWYDHMPHVSGRGHDYYLANWWRYMVDVEQFKGTDGNLVWADGIPEVRILAPDDGAGVSGVVNVTVRADVDGALGRVDLYVDGAYLATDTMTPYAFTWDSTGTTGAVALQARAYELQNGTEAVSPVHTVIVEAAAAPPGEVSAPGSAEPLRFTDAITLVWEAATPENRVEWFNVYRGNLGWLDDGLAGSCRLPGLEANTASDPEAPWPGSGWFYLVTGANGGGEGSRGDESGGAPRPTTAACK